MIAEEVAHFRNDPIDVFPCGGDEHRCGVVEFAPAARAELEGFVEHRGVGTALVDDRYEQIFGGQVLGP